MAVVVRAPREADRPAIEAIARAALSALSDSPSVAQWGADMRRGFIEGWLPAGLTQKGHRLVVAEVDGEVVGGGSVQHGERHPHAFMRISVHPTMRDRGVGAAMFEALAGDDVGPFVVREMRSDPATISFFTNRGFVTGERTVEGLIDPQRNQTVAWCDSVLALSPEVTIEAPGAKVSREEIAEAADKSTGGPTPGRPHSVWKRQPLFVSISAVPARRVL